MKEDKITIFGKFPEGVRNTYKKLTITDKRIIWIFLGALILSITISGTISTIRNYNSDLSISECSSLIKFQTNYYLSLQEQNNILAFLYNFSTPFAFLIVAIGVGWILHGVGFKVVGR